MMTIKCSDIRIFIVFIAGWLAWSSAVADDLELVQLQNRPAQELISILKPHLETGEAMTGRGYQLILRASPQRRDELKSLIRQLDAELAQLRISVRRADAAEMRAENQRLQGNLHVLNGSVDGQARIKLHRTERKGSDRDRYVVNTLEGQPAFIAEGLAFPAVGSSVQIINGRRIVTNELQYQQLESGFYALARVHGDQVTVTASPQREQLSPGGGGRIESSALITTVRGPLGQWLQLGGVDSQEQRQSTGTLHRTESKRHAQNQIWIKVDVVNSD